MNKTHNQPGKVHIFSCESIKFKKNFMILHLKNEMKLALLKPSNKEGVKGMLPLGCLPHWGREGVTLQTVDKKKRISGK